MRRLALLLASVALCTACTGSLLRSSAEAPERYRLEGPAALAGATTLPLAVEVTRPRASSSLDTDRIAVTTPGSGFDYVADARWADPAPQMLQRLLVDALTSDAHFATAVAAPSRVPADLLLDAELKRFEAVYSNVDEPPIVVVDLGVNLVDARKGTRIVSFQITTTAPAARNHRADVVAAFRQATDQAVHDAVTRVAAAAARP